MHTRTPDSRTQEISGNQALKLKLNESFFHYLFECTLKDTLTAKMVMFCHHHIVVPPVFEHQPSKAVVQLLAACQVNYFREIEVEGITIFS